MLSKLPPLPPLVLMLGCSRSGPPEARPHPLGQMVPVKPGQPDEDEGAAGCRRTLRSRTLLMLLTRVQLTRRIAAEDQEGEWQTGPRRSLYVRYYLSVYLRRWS